MISERFERMLLPALENEGVRLGKTAGYSNIPYDIGGKTIFGIASKKWKKEYTVIKNLWTQGLKKAAYILVVEFYDTHFWNHLYDKIKDESLCFRIFDFGINGGVNTSIFLLQQALNKYFNGKIIEDGIFGEITLNRVNFFTKYKVFNAASINWNKIPLIEKESKLYSAYVFIISLWYKERKTFWKFGRGWFNRLRKIYNENRETCGKIRWKIVITKMF